MKKAERLAREIFSDQDLEEISEAIKVFEGRTSGEIVISFNTTSNGQPYKTTRRIFEKAKLFNTKERNATLITLFLTEQKFAVYGDEGIHARVPENFWEETVEAMRTAFTNGQMKAGLLKGINALGENLSKYFPVDTDDVNELSNDLKFGDHEDE
ncbi:MAG: TPM domain-containing protein [Candidatus Marinimicrobia bacterium]|nr:TPM domain-containing protein [Candidatus Neomarinimicrobiota bacterium]MCF7850219.1 TPM domain-containing protein [Candidatus Neomarinimicrobiota bacterium]MCF7903739.1 TPM domain-containing protein [Candidatus Neomarinimicrobiota bacterium]